MRKGSVKTDSKGRIIARVTFTDDNGVRHDLRRVVPSKSEGHERVKQMLREIDDHGGVSLTTEIRTFNQLADEYQRTEMTAPRYAHDKKISGLRSYKRLESPMKVLRAYFGNKAIKDITYRQLEKFKTHRFDTPIETGFGKDDRVRSVASVNRELSLLRRMFKIAVQEGWMTKDPFSAGKPLISLSEEVVRNRILSLEEETALLEKLTDERAHLFPVVVCAIDTGMRRGEITSLRWENVDLENRVITIKALNTKTLKERQVPISDRLAKELQTIRNGATERVFKNEKVFQLGSTFRRAWTTALRLAKIEDFHFHDLRATFATRLLDEGLANSLVAKILGHSSTAMTDRYIRTDNSIINKAAELINKMRKMV